MTVIAWSSTGCVVIYKSIYFKIKLYKLVQSVPKRMKLGFCLISRQPSIGFLNSFFPPEIEIHMQFLNTNPFLCDFWGLIYL